MGSFLKVLHGLELLQIKQFPLEYEYIPEFIQTNTVGTVGLEYTIRLKDFYMVEIMYWLTLV